MAKLIDTTTQKHHTQDMHIKRWLKGLFILLLTLIFVTASLYASHADSIRYSTHTTGGIYYDRFFIIMFLQFCVCALLTLSRICTLLVLFWMLAMETPLTSQIIDKKRKAVKRSYFL